MAVDISTPYEKTPYDMMSHPDLEPLSSGASTRQIDERWNVVSRKGKRGREVQDAWGVLRTPAKRLSWDIFQSGQGGDGTGVLKKLSALPADFPSPASPELAFCPELVAPPRPPAGPPPLEVREVEWQYLASYAQPERLLRQVEFDQ